MAITKHRVSTAAGKIFANPLVKAMHRVGLPFPGTEVRAVDHAGRAVATGSVGAAQVRGPSLFVGYARDGLPSRELTDDAFLAASAEGRLPRRGFDPGPSHCAVHAASPSP